MNIKQIEEAILQLPLNELSKLTDWLVEYRARLWDAEIEADLDSGTFDDLLDEVNREYEAGIATFL